MNRYKAKKYKIHLPYEVDLFYKKISEGAGYPIETVLCDCLTKYAGELAERAAGKPSVGR